MVKLLIVEDDPLIARLYTEAFKLSGHEVEVAFDGEQGFQKLQEMKTKPTLILMDVMMPKMNGLQLLERIKKDPGTKNIPVVMLTNVSDEENVEKALNLGAVTYLVKSQYTPKEVVGKVKEIIAGYATDNIPEVKVVIKNINSPEKNT